MSSAKSSSASVSVQPLPGALGAEIRGVDFLQPLTASVHKQIEEAWTKHLVRR
jgi:alpha-ketoglutarate-dependent taurine dioxygenase